VGLSVTTAAVGFIQMPLVLDHLPRETAGIWFLFLSFGVYISFLDLGVSPTLSREIGFVLGDATAGESERRRRIAALVATCTRIFQVVVVGVLFLGAAATGALVGRFPLRPDVWAAWGLFLVGAAVNILGASPAAALFGLGHVATERSLKSCGLVIGLLLTAVALRLGLGLPGLSAAWVIQNAVIRLAAGRLLRRFHPELAAASGSFDREIFRRIVGPSIKWAAMGLGALLILYTDNPIIAATLGPGRIPPYEAAMRAVSTLMTLSLILSTSSAPFLSRAFAAGDMDACRLLVSRNLRVGVGAMLFLATFLAVFGRPVVDLWLGPGHFVGAPVLCTLLVLLSLECHHVIAATAVMAAGRVVFFWPAVIAGALKITLSFLLARRFDLLGVALGTVIAQLLTNNWFAPWMALRVFRIRVARYAVEVMVPLVVFAMTASAVHLFGRRWLFEASSPGLSLVVCLGLSATLGAAAGAVFLLTGEERSWIADRLRRGLAMG
jgi:O-antigen/teichoic acid export membrane protein